MKKFSAILLATVFCVAMLLTAGAGYVFDNDEKFSIELDDKFVYSEEQSGEKAYYFNDVENEGENLVINYVNNSGEKFSVFNFDEEYSLEDYMEDLTKETREQYERAGYDMDVEFYDVKTEKAENGFTAITVKAKTEAVVEGQTITFYQKLYQYAGNESIYTVTYTVYDEGKIDDLDNAVSNMVINEEEAPQTDETMSTIISVIFLVVVMAVAIVVSVVINKKKAEKKKNQPIKSAYDQKIDLNS